MGLLGLRTQELYRTPAKRIVMCILGFRIFKLGIVILVAIDVLRGNFPRPLPTQKALEFNLATNIYFQTIFENWRCL